MNFQDARKIVEMAQTKMSAQEVVDSYLRYDLECSFTFENVFTIDMYIMAHLFGWICFGLT